MSLILLLVEPLKHLSKIFVMDKSTLTWEQELFDIKLFTPVYDQVTLQHVKVE